MEKARDAFRTISEVAKWLETPAHVLRFWESKFSQVKPVKRAGGRRYYRPGDMELLGGIKKLLHEDGMTIKGVQKILREEGIKQVSAHSPPLNLDTDLGDFEDGPEVIEAPANEAAEADTATPLSGAEIGDDASTAGDEETAEDAPKAAPPPPVVSPEMAEHLLLQSQESERAASKGAEAAIPSAMNGAATGTATEAEAEAEAEAEDAATEPQEVPSTPDVKTAEPLPEPAQAAPGTSADDAPEPAQDPSEATEPEAPKPLVCEGADSDPADDALEVPPAIAAQIRAMDKAAMTAQRDQIAPLYARLSALRDRMGR